MKRSITALTKQARVVTPESVRLMVQLYTKERLPIRAIGERTGVSYGTVHRYLKGAGVTMRARTRHTPADTLPPADTPRAP